VSGAATHATVAVDRVAAAAYEIPTETERESDGTLVWDSTTLVVVEVDAGGRTGLGYTPCHPPAVDVIVDRQLGHAGLAMMAVSAIDVALWDLKARLLDVCLADALPRFHESVALYGSGGFTSYDLEHLRDQVHGWAADGFPRVKIKVGRDKAADPRRVAAVRAAVGDDVEVMVDGNGAYTPKEALLWAARFAEHDVRWFEGRHRAHRRRGCVEPRFVFYFRRRSCRGE
jgi:L-alanine-DL-glutamate epimerase-like enolase superfamily enzyme